MRLITLKNEQLTVGISTKGAELQSLQHVNGIQYMWSGDSAFWGKHSPVLFPIVGTLKNNTYYYNDKAYELPRHGFARDMIFTGRQLNALEAIFTLADTEETRKIFPFSFILKLHYRLSKNRLLCTYEVSNPGNGELLFSIGGHPAFAVPITDDSEYTDYYLLFTKPEPLYRYKLQDGLTGNERELVTSVASKPPNVSGIKLPLSPALFYEDAIVLKHLENHYTSLLCDKHTHGLHFDFTGFPYLGIWAAKDAPFVCIEPWCGITDNVNHNQQLKDKEGIIPLKPGGTWQRSWSVTCF